MLTPDQIPATAHSAAADVFVAMATAELFREKVDAIKTELLGADIYMSEALEGRGKSIPARRITIPKEDWLLDDEGFSRYLAKLDARVRSEVPGAADLDEGKCPALVAEHALIRAEHAFLEVTAPLFNITAEQINRSLDIRAKWLDSWLGLCASC